MSADIINLDEMRSSTATPAQQQTDPTEPPRGFFTDEEEQQLHDERRQRVWRVVYLAKAGDVAAVEKIADYARELLREVRDFAMYVGHARQIASGHNRERYTTPDSNRPWDIAGFDGQTVSEQTERYLEEVRLLLAANKPQEALHAVGYAHGVLESALERQQQFKRRAAERERQQRKAARGREELERERRRIERQLKALD